MEADLPRTFYDLIPGWLVIAGTVVIFLLATEIGFQLARRRERAPDAEEKSHAGVLLAALLALLGLLLAFSFSIVGGRFLERKQLVVKEANAIGTAYLRAEMLPQPQRDRIENLLREYVETRMSRGGPEQLVEAMRGSAVLQQALWTEAINVAARQPESEIVGLFVRSLNDVFDLHEERMAVGIYHRLSPVVLATLGAVALLTMGLLGYSAGLARSRSPLPTVSVVAAIAVVVSLIVELDRPWQRLVPVSQRALADVQETMSKQY